MKPVAVTDLDLIFPGGVKHLMPPDIAEIRRVRSLDRTWKKFVDTWFFQGVDAKPLVPKPGIDKALALRHLRCIIGSFEPKHEDKVASIIYLLDEWFEPLDPPRGSWLGDGQ